MLNPYTRRKSINEEAVLYLTLHIDLTAFKLKLTTKTGVRPKVTNLRKKAVNWHARRRTLNTSDFQRPSVCPTTVRRQCDDSAEFKKPFSVGTNSLADGGWDLALAICPPRARFSWTAWPENVKCSPAQNYSRLKCGALDRKYYM